LPNTLAQGYPVRSYDFDAAEDPDRALATEMRELADHLKAGATPLLPSLAVIVGKSERQIKRYLATDEDPAQLPRTTGWG
jgi:plasmid stabilization system protein ParE